MHIFHYKPMNKAISCLIILIMMLSLAILIFTTIYRKTKSVKGGGQTINIKGGADGFDVLLFTHRIVGAILFNCLVKDEVGTDAARINEFLGTRGFLDEDGDIKEDMLISHLQRINVVNQDKNMLFDNVMAYFVEHGFADGEGVGTEAGDRLEDEMAHNDSWMYPVNKSDLNLITCLSPVIQATVITELLVAPIAPFLRSLLLRLLLDRIIPITGVRALLTENSPLVAYLLNDEHADYIISAPLSIPVAGYMTMLLSNCLLLAGTGPKYMEQLNKLIERLKETVSPWRVNKLRHFLSLDNSLNEDCITRYMDIIVGQYEYIARAIMETTSPECYIHLYTERITYAPPDIVRSNIFIDHNGINILEPLQACTDANVISRCVRRIYDLVLSNRHDLSDEIIGLVFMSLLDIIQKDHVIEIFYNMYGYEETIAILSVYLNKTAAGNEVIVGLFSKVVNHFLGK